MKTGHLLVNLTVLDDDKQGPHAMFAYGTQTVKLADFSDDWLTDLVRIHNGEVGCWRNFGCGLFGLKATVDNVYADTNT
jgi:hypothetical protein